MIKDILNKYSEKRIKYLREQDQPVEQNINQPPNTAQPVQPDAAGQVDPFSMAPQQEPVKDLTHLGRVYELKKIYHRLYALDKILQKTTDEKLQPVKKMTREVFEIYKMILSNIKSYEDKLDDIILRYYEYIGKLCNDLDDILKPKT